jgi:hypothetical protein
MIDSYSKLSIGKYQEVLECIGTGDYSAGIIAVLNDMDIDEVLNLPLSEYRNLSNKASFLLDSPQPAKVCMEYKLGSFKLEVLCNLSKMTAGQYIDYQTFVKEPDKYLVEMISVFLIPKGCKYNEGYDIMEVQKAIRECLSISDALALSAFFLNLSQALINSTVTSLIRRLKRMMKKEKNQEIRMKMQEAITHLEQGGDGLHLLTEFQR